MFVISEGFRDRDGGIPTNPDPEPFVMFSGLKISGSRDTQDQNFVDSWDRD